MEFVMIEDWKKYAENCIFIWKTNNFPMRDLLECELDFFTTVLNHIEFYVIPQYGGENDVLSKMTKQDAIIACEYAINKYKARRKTSQRQFELGIDCLKIAHYAQLLSNFSGNPPFTPEDILEVWESFNYWRKLSTDEKYAQYIR